MKIRSAIAGLALLGTLGLSACEFPTPCEGLEVSAQDKEAAANGYEVERQDSSGNTCELSQDGTQWSVDD